MYIDLLRELGLRWSSIAGTCDTLAQCLPNWAIPPPSGRWNDSEGGERTSAGSETVEGRLDKLAMLRLKHNGKSDEEAKD
ncbi:hypothetical protein K0M31_017208 [Melipona bicolor]|uniref:Uncharacterized protein n=1 Tax=Melipona bicolor TaxID=60889 RepID=A0AA40KS81_9HYME|nr:hypothetical protein K0M31_017208 [Melipona bicolor]